MRELFVLEKLNEQKHMILIKNVLNLNSFRGKEF
jgi:hypothetical protein